MDPAEIFAHFPRLQTSRLLLRAFVPEDASALFRILGDERVSRYYDLDPFTDPSQATTLIERFQQRHARGIGLRWAICQRTAPSTLLGSAGYNLWWQPAARGLLGYDLDPAVWRQGIMSEALTAILNFGFEEMNLNRVEALVCVGNAASHGLLTHLGFHSEGVLREYEYIKGRFQDMTMYSCLRRDRRKG